MILSMCGFCEVLIGLLAMFVSFCIGLYLVARFELIFVDACEILWDEFWQWWKGVEFEDDLK